MAAYVPPSLRRKQEAEAAAAAAAAAGAGSTQSNSANSSDASNASSNNSSSNNSAFDNNNNNNNNNARTMGRNTGLGGSNNSMGGNRGAGMDRSVGVRNNTYGNKGFGGNMGGGNQQRGGVFAGGNGQAPATKIISTMPFPRRRYFEEDMKEIFGDIEDRKAAPSGGIDFDKFFDIPVKMTGDNKDEIKELKSFQEAGEQLPESVSKNVERVGYNKPTPVQKWSIPCIFAKRDLMTCAQTGSGKTAAFLFPVVSRMIKDGPPPEASGHYKPEYPVCLVLSPTRELATQIYDEARKFCYKTGVRPCVVYGGIHVKLQQNEIRKGCDIVVATPGRLQDLVQRQSISLAQCTYLILDEADRMLDMGFMPQITEIVDRTDLPTSQEGRQTIMFSATFPPAIQKIAQDFMKDYLFLTVGRVGSSNESIEQVVAFCHESEKEENLMNLLNNINGLTLVFVETKRKADNLAGTLNFKGIGTVAIHGDRDQNERNHALHSFKTGQVTVMVATDVASRGLDINDVMHVVNFDMPANIDDYVHRIGRTGRAGNKGRSTSFIGENNTNIIQPLITVLQDAHQNIPAWLYELVRSNSSSQQGGSKFGGGGHQRGYYNDFRSSNNDRSSNHNTPPVPAPGRRTPNKLTNQNLYEGW